MALHIVRSLDPAATTARLAAVYRDLPPGSAVWLTPTRRAADRVRPRLAQGVAPHVESLTDFAAAIVRAHDPTVRLLPASQRTLLVDALLADAHAAGKLPYFSRVADSRGFADALLALFAQLRRHGVEPKELARGSAKLRELGWLCTVYQERLTAHGWLDPEGIVGRAAEVVRNGRPWLDAEVTTLFVDGFSGLVRPERELLTALLGQIEEGWLSLPGEPSPKRAEVFAEAEAARETLVEFAPKVEFVPSGQRPAGLGHLAAALFRSHPRVSPASDAAGLHCIEAPGRVGEWRLIARHVATHLRNGVPADSIVVAVRDVAAVGVLAAEVFAEYDIPCDFDGTEPLSRRPAVAALLRAARLDEESWPFAGITALLRSHFFAPSSVADPELPRRTETLLRYLAEPRGKDAYLRAVTTWADSPPEPLEDEQADEPRRQRIQRLAHECRPFLTEFFKLWDRAPRVVAAENHIDWLRRFARDIGLSATADAVDQADLDRLWRELDDWAARSRPTHGHDAARLTRTAFLRAAFALAGAVKLPHSARGPGRVRVVPTEEAVAADAEVLILAGLGEGSFPRLTAAEPLLDEADRQTLRNAGVPLSSLDERLASEMLLFLRLIARPTRELVLSYAAVDEQGQPLLPGSFLSAAKACFTANTIPTTRQRMVIEGFLDREPLSAAEHRVRVAAFVAARPGRDAALSEFLPPELAAHLADARRMARARFDTPDEFTVFDGLIRHPDALARLAVRFAPERVFSPTALETYASCPFRFFLEQVLRVEPLEEPDEEVEHTRRGSAVHRALARLHRRLREPQPDTAAQVAEEMAAAVTEYARRAPTPAGRVLWELEGRRLARAAARYEGHWNEFRKPWREVSVTPVPHSVEADFGLTLLDRDGTVIESEFAALELTVGEMTVRIGGRIDRLDVAELPEGELGFWVIDYKTGRTASYTATGLKTFRKLQLPLYALAAERVLFADRTARPLGLAYWLVTDRGARRMLPDKPAAWLSDAAGWERYRATLEAWVVELARRARLGEFPLAPRDADCTSGCAFGRVCRIAQSRPVGKVGLLELPTLRAEAETSDPD